MYMPDTVPSTLEEMMEFLRPSIDDGLFDAIEYDNPSSPTKILCKQNGVSLIEISTSDRDWSFLPYVGQEGSIAGDEHKMSTTLGVVCRCKGGIIFRSTQQGSPFYYFNFIIGKLNTGKTAFIQFSGVNDFDYTNTKYYTTSFDDNTGLYTYVYGYVITSNYLNGMIADRTILSAIPSTGKTGSTDYFETVKVRTLVQFVEMGSQLIGDKHYWCIGTIAILDE